MQMIVGPLFWGDINQENSVIPGNVIHFGENMLGMLSMLLLLSHITSILNTSFIDNGHWMGDILTKVETLFLLMDFINLRGKETKAGKMIELLSLMNLMLIIET